MPSSLRYSVSGLLWSTFAAMVLGTAAVAGLLWYQADRADSARNDANAVLRRLELVESAEVAALEERAALGAMALPPEENASGDRRESRARGLQAISELDDLVGDGPEGANYRVVAARYRQASKELDELWAMADSGDLHGAIIGLVSGPVRADLDLLTSDLETLAAEERSELHTARAAEGAAWRNLTVSVLAAMAGAVVVLLVVGIIFVRALVIPVRGVAAIADEIANGHVDRRALMRGPREVTSLASSVNRMCESLISRSHQLTTYLSRNLEARTEELENSNRELASEVTRRGAAEARVREREERLQLILDSTPELILFVDPAGRVAYCNSAFERTFAVPADLMIGRNAVSLFAPPEKPPPGAHVVPNLLERLLTGPISLQLATNPPTYVEAEAFRSVDSASADPGIVVVARDVTERRRAELELAERRTAEEALLARIAHQAYHDPLTDLPNRSLLMERVGEALASGEPAALLFIDLDDFKSINDTLGHEAGDQGLLAAAERLTVCLPDRAFAARLGGDEFAVLLRAGSASDLVVQSAATAEAILASLRQPLLLRGNELYLRASIGVAHSASSKDAADLLRQADVAMYQAKSLGKSRYAVFDVAMDTETSSALSLLNELERSLLRKEFEVFYQPVIHLETGAAVGVEALVRWRHPEHGLLLPHRFIPLAEASGRIRELDRWTLHRACRDARRWIASRQVPDTFTVAVNVSAAEVFEVDFLDSVRGILADTGLCPANLTIELTESTVLRDADAAFATLGKLRATGVRVALDDFGTGYSSLSYLRQMPIDVLKVDRSFIDGALSDPRGQELASSIVEMAHKLGYTVVAEGIEVESQWSWLKSIGCTLGQGHMFLPAVPQHELSRYLAESRSRQETRPVAA